MWQRQVRRVAAAAAPPVARGAAEAAKVECTKEARRRNLECAICREGFDLRDPAYRLAKCPGDEPTHAFHTRCVDAWFARGSGRCPVCRAHCLVSIGTQPVEGTMSDLLEPGPLPGFPPSSATRVITYVFPDGVQGPEHPNPGLPYTGTTRTAYLPSPEADRHFRLLQLAFRRRLVFRVGQSITTGRDNCVIWAGIHHKTNRHAGEFGYPDGNYLKMLLVELQNNGVVDDDLPADPPLS
mmetsp:Transcript_5991/g.18053  ORF Transcript_5991/g.18053 Transcript_5991/m.18053 type:complete len:239 (+) Transcript_5991:3-719(+)